MASETGVEAPGDRERGMLLAFHSLGPGESGLIALDEPSQAICARAWRDFQALDEAAQARCLAAWRAPVASALPTGLSRLHPSWRQEALAGERAEVRATLEDRVPGAALPDETRREIARIAFAWLGPLAESDGGPLSDKLCGLEFEELLSEVTRLGARTVGLSLAGAAPALRARAMALAGEPWAKVIGEASVETVSRKDRSIATVLASTSVASQARAPAERMLAIGVAALRARLAEEHPGSPFRVAGRLPAPLGRALVGW